MKKPLLSIILILVLSISLTQTAIASDITVTLTGQKEDCVHSPVSEDGVTLFPIGEILKFLDLSGTETVKVNGTPWYSNVTFQGHCFKITEKSTDIRYTR